MTDKVQLSVVVPCYNEEKNISLIVNRFLEIKPKNINAELILVDNGSTDSSNKLIKQLAKKYRFIKSIHIKKNIGYGFGVWSGLREAKGEHICWTHADMQTDLADTIKAYNIITKEKNPKGCFVKGSRKKRPFFDTFFMYGMSVFETIILKTILFDINAQPNLFHKSFLDHINNPPIDFSFDLYCYYMAKNRNFEIIKFPVLFPKRIHGISHWNTSLAEKWRFIKRTLDFSFKLRGRLKNANNHS